MADRFPLIVNPVSRKIEELVAGDNLDLTGNGIAIDGNIGLEGQFLRSNGDIVEWAFSGDVFISGLQTISDKIFTNCTLSGNENIFSNIPNNSLINSTIIINGSSISLGESVTTPNDNTTYSLSAVDGSNDSRKAVRLTSGGSGASTTEEVTFIAGSNVTLARTGNDITINSSFTDTNTVTSLKSAVAGTAVTGEVIIDAAGSTTVSQNGNVITITGSDTDTITRIRSNTGESFLPGDFTFLAGGASSISQTDKTITISSQDTITRLRGGTLGSYEFGDITITGSGSTTVSQTDKTITINSVDTNTITRFRGTTSGTYVDGDITITATGSATISQVDKVININAIDTNTLYDVSPTGGLSVLDENFSLKNSINLGESKVLKWDNSNNQLVNSIIDDDGSTVTVNGDLNVTGLTTTINSETIVVADNEIELRKGNNIVGSNGGIRLNRTTNSTGVATAFTSLQWNESGGYWRVWNGSVENRLVTTNEVQTLTNKTLTSPILTAPTLGAATATTINGLGITPTISSSLNINNSKTLEVSNSVRFTSNLADSSVTVNLASGGTVAYTSNTLAVFAPTTSTQLRGVISDSTGVGVAVFNQNPSFTNSIRTSSSTFDLFNTTVTTINAFGVATNITLGSQTSGSTTIRHDLNVLKNITLGSVVGDILTVNASANFDTNDITIRGSGDSPIKIGRGGNSIASNTRFGFNCLESNTVGFNNTMVGYESGYLLSDGYNNTGYGYRALRTLNDGFQNVAVGTNAGVSVISGSKNVAVGFNALSGNLAGEGNVCIGNLAGANCTGSGNVIIGSALEASSSNSTYGPPSVSGNNQLVIGSGTGTWIRGDNNYNVTTPNNLTVIGNAQINGNLIINGTTTTINSSTISVDDKNIELGSVEDASFTGTVTSGSNTVTDISNTTGLIPGMVVNIVNAGFAVPEGTEITSVGINEVVLSGVSNNTGIVTFNAVGPSNTTANGGGLTLKGSTDKLFYWSLQDLAWVSSEDITIPEFGQYRLGTLPIADGLNSIFGPGAGTWSLGSAVTTSSLTTVGTLSSLTVSGLTTFQNDVSISNSNLTLTDGTDNRLILIPDSFASKIVGSSSGVILMGGSDIDDGRAPKISLINGDKIVLESADNSGIELHYGKANKKLEVTSSGVDITGTLSSTSVSTGIIDFSGLLVTHDGSNGSIINAIGELSITGGPVGSNINIQAATGTNGIIVSTTSAQLYYSGSKKLETTNTGASVTGTLVADGILVEDNETITVGTGGDFSISHNGADTYISNITGNLYLTDNGNSIFIQPRSGENSVACNADGSVELFWDNNKKFETSSTGVTVTGTITADAVSLGDSEKILFGAGNDLEIYHDGNNSAINDVGVGDLYIQGSNSIYIRDYDTSENHIVATKDGAVTLYHNGEAKLATTATGANVTGDIGLSGELNFSNPSAKYIDFYTKDATNNVFGVSLRLVNHDSTSFHTGISMVRDAGVSLYYNNNIKFQTTNTGASVTGTLSAADLSITNAVSFEGINLANNKILAVGDTAGGDLKIYHDGTNSFIEASGLGDLYIKGEDIYIQTNDSEASAYFLQNGGVELYHNALKKFETTATGATITGTLITDGVTLGVDEVASFGSIAPLQISYDSTLSNALISCESPIRVTTAGFIVKNAADNQTGIEYSESTQSVDLYFGGSKKFETTSTGVNITGDINFTGNITQNGSPLQTGGSDTFNPFLLMGA